MTVPPTAPSQPRTPDRPVTPRPPTIGFFMEQVAGHTTHYRTLRAVVDREATIRPVWREITYRRPGGRLERLHDRLPWLPYYPFGVARALTELHAAFAGGPYDAVLLNSRVGLFLPGAVRRVPCLLDTDVTPVQLDRLPGYAGPADPVPVVALKRGLFRRFVQSLHGIVAWSTWAAASFRDDYGVPAGRIVVSPPGVDLAFWRPAPRPPGDGRPLRVLFVGGDFRRKGGDALLRWYAGAAPPGCELHLVTREPVAARPGVTVYAAMQPNTPELLRLYQTADLFVLPSHGECFGIATVEAMACGLPVVMTDVGGAGDIVAPGETGWLIPAGDAAALRESLAPLLADEALRRRMGQAGRARAEARFDAVATARRRLDLLKEAAANGAAHGSPRPPRVGPRFIAPRRPRSR